MRNGSGQSERFADSPSGARRRRFQLRLAVALPLVTGVLTLGVGLYGYLSGRTDAAAALSAREAAREAAQVFAAPIDYWWLVALTAFGALVGLAVALAFTRPLRKLTRRTEEIAHRNFRQPLELEADAEVQPLVSAINELLESVQDYARHSLSDGVITLDREGVILGLNPRVEVALGVEADEVLGDPYTALLPKVPGNERIRSALETILRAGEPFDLHDVPWVNGRGQRIEVDVQGTVLSGDEPIVSLIVVFDRSADLEMGQRQVNRAHRLLLIGGFASELAHEIRNPLSSVMGLVDLLRDRLPEGDPGHRHLDVLERAAERIEGLVVQLLDLVPTEGDELEPLDPGEVVADAVDLVRASRPGDEEVTLAERYGDDVPPVRLDVERFSRAVDNVLRNAYAHADDGGRIEVITRKAPRGGAEIEISNTGSYVPEEERDRIFQPFVSKRSAGSGLGLAIAQQIVYAHGGSIRVESDRESGTSFILTLPPAAGAGEGAQPGSGRAHHATRP